MRSFLVYTGLQLKRALRLLPGMLAICLLLTALAALGALLVSRLGGDREAEKSPVRIGVVGELDQGYLREGLQMLQSMDPSRFSLRLEPMAEDEAAALLRRGELAGYVRVPEDFVERWTLGEHPPLIYLSRGDGVGARLVREIADTAVSLVLETENAVYGAQNFVADRMPGENPYAMGDRLVLRYALRILDRERLYGIEMVETPEGISLAAQLLCGLALLFVMLWAICCAPLFSRRSRELQRVLSARGLRGGGQVASEFAAFVVLLLAAGTFVLLLGALLARRFDFAVPELAALSGTARLLLLLRALPVALMLCALSFLLYELAQGAVGGVLLQFLNALLQGYLAGCLLPASFFPEKLQRFGAGLPAGLGLARLRALLQGGTEPSVAVWGLLLLFLLLAAAIRDRRSRA